MKMTFNEREYELTEKIGKTYYVWNIGKNMGNDEYLPLCELVSKYEINPDTLKAIKLNKEEVQLLRSAAGWGISSLKEAQKALRSKRSGYISNKKREHAKLTIEIFERISE